MSHERVGALLLSALIAGCAPGRDGPAGPAWDDELAERQDEAHGHRHVVYVHNWQGFLARAGDRDTALIVATTSTDPGGNYVFAACPEGVEERSDPSCGQVTLGEGSGVYGAGRNEVRRGLPTGRVLTRGPLFDCAALMRGPEDWATDDGNGWDLGCFEIAGGNTLSGIAIDNGTEVVPQQPGAGSHRNGVLVKPGRGTALIEHSVFTDVRRAALVVVADGEKTEFVARNNITRRTELANFNLLGSEAPPAPVNGSEMDALLEQNWMDEIGRLSLAFLWSPGGNSNHAEGRFVDNVVGPNTLFGVVVAREGLLDPERTTDSTVRVEVEGGRIESQVMGVAMWSYGFDPDGENDRNSVRVDVEDVTFVNNELAVDVEWDPWGPHNVFRMGLEGNRYDGADPGQVGFCAWDYDVEDCVDPGADPPFRFEGTREELEQDNRNFSFELPDVLFEDDNHGGHHHR